MKEGKKGVRGREREEGRTEGKEGGREGVGEGERQAWSLLPQSL